MNTRHDAEPFVRRPEDRRESFTLYGGGSMYNNLIIPKAMWGGCSPDHAFSEDSEWAYKRQSQQKFYAALEQERKVFWEATRAAGMKRSEAKADPQISAFYTSFPWPARASVGHTVFMEAARYKENIVSRVHAFLEDSQRPREYGLSEDGYKIAVGITVEALGNRALFDMLEQVPRLDGVEFYRLFQAAVHSLNFRSLKEIVNTVVLLGDVLPEPDTLNVHPLTRRILDALSGASRRYWREAAQSGRDGDSDVYLEWGSSLMEQLVRFLPPREQRRQKPVPRAPESEGSPRAPQPEPAASRIPERQDAAPPETIPPLNEPGPPLLDNGACRPVDPLEQMRQKLRNKMSEHEERETEDPGAAEAKKIVDAFFGAAAEATAQKNKWENIREDLVEETLAGNPFDRGPMEGQETNGISINREMGGKQVGGELFDRAVALCDDWNEVQRLRSRAAPIVKKLLGNLYPNTGKEFAMEYPRASGQMDPRRLPVAEVCDAVYRRYQTFNVTSPVGRSLLLIAADASGSLSDVQMQMCKCLMTAWLDSVHSARLQVLAAFYHSGSIRPHVSGPLVQWVYHPRKTPVYAPGDAVRAVASLPDSGSGAQSDALSLTYMLDEAASLSRGAFVYLTLISDCAFNRSFHMRGTTGAEEVAEMFSQARERLEGRLHITLVGLSENIPGEITEAVDAVVSVNEDALKNPEQVAENIGIYVAACIRNRRRETESNKQGR